MNEAKRQKKIDSFFRSGPRQAEGTSSEKKLNVYDRDDQRQVQEAWFKVYPWLVVEGTQFFCEWCRQAKRVNVYTKGKSTGKKPKKDDLEKPQKTGDHKLAAKAKERKAEFLTAASNSYNQVKDAIICLMRIIYYKAIHLQAYDDLADLVEMQILNGSDCMRHLQMSGSINYTHYESIHDFLDSMVFVAQEKILDAARASPGKLYALMLDESTDTSRLSTLMVYIRFIDGETGLVRNHFLCVTGLEGNTASDIFKTTVSVLEVRGLDPKDVVSLGTDGASVISGN